MNNYKRRYWNISEDTKNKILSIYDNNKDCLKCNKIVYGEIIKIAIDNLTENLKNETLGDIIEKLYY